MTRRTSFDFGLPSLGVYWPIALLGFFATTYLSRTAPLDSSRPAVAPKEKFDNEVPGVPGVRGTNSKLWEDPLAVANSDWQRLSPKEKEEYQDANVRKSLAGLLPPGMEPDGQLIVMPVFVPGGNFSEDVETRRRTRYAVLRALYANGFRHSFAKRMSYVPIRVKTYALPSAAPIESELLLPLKLFVCDQTGQRALLLWVDADRLGYAPRYALEGILGRLFDLNQHHAKLRVCIIGPASSNELQTLVAECDPSRFQLKPEHQWLRADKIRPEMWSPRVTIHGSRFGDATSRDAAKAQAAVDSFRENFSFHRVIGSDDLLVGKLFGELFLRGAITTERDSIILLKESETSYANYLCETFYDKVRREMGADDAILRIGYLRGLDGATPDRPESRSSPSNNASEWENEAPSGNSQRDYLRRLTRVLDGENHGSRRTLVRAVGIFGSDVHDKLVILRALRATFPDAWFFTTDLDARFNDPSELAFTRNLVVASHFDLGVPELNVDQPRMAPFRDSYQTATFYAVQGALGVEIPFWASGGDENGTMTDARFKANVYEIGRTRPIRIEEQESVVAQELLKVFAFRGGMTLLICSVLIYLWQAPQALKSSIGQKGRDIRAQLRSERWLLWYVLAAVLVLLGGMVWFCIEFCSNKDLIEWDQGVSAWPSFVIRLGCGIAGLATAAGFMRVQQSETESICSEFGLERERFADFGSDVRRRFDRTRFFTPVAYSLFFFLLFWLFVPRFSIVFVPARTSSLFTVIDWMALLGHLFVTFLVLDQAQFLRLILRNASHLSVTTTSLTERQRTAFLKDYGIDEQNLDKIREVTDAWWCTHLIAQITRPTSRIIYLPFIYLAVLILSFSQSFDRWNLSLPLFAFWIIPVILSWVSWWAVRDRAQKLRSELLNGIRSCEMRLADAGKQAEGLKSQVEILESQIRGDSRGAFQSLGRDPLLRAPVIPTMVIPLLGMNAKSLVETLLQLAN